MFLKDRCHLSTGGIVLAKREGWKGQWSSKGRAMGPAGDIFLT